jgi:hypothetical protein
MVGPLFSLTHYGTPLGKSNSRSQRRPTVGISFRGEGRGAGDYSSRPLVGWAVAGSWVGVGRRGMSSGEIFAAADSQGERRGRTWGKGGSGVWVVSFHFAAGARGSLQLLGRRILLQFVVVRRGKLNGGQAGRRPRAARSLPCHVSWPRYLGVGA